ncbi:MAG TPA: hypothetical protein VFA20_20685 [Myxococcaceae bacterium]|nr:hypothetical protein [Myxococcaceae bacterium]
MGIGSIGSQLPKTIGQGVQATVGDTGGAGQATKGAAPADTFEQAPDAGKKAKAGGGGKGGKAGGGGKGGKAGGAADPGAAAGPVDAGGAQGAAAPGGVDIAQILQQLQSLVSQLSAASGGSTK